jgi:N-acetylmuramoyl-L-alanine amidase
METPAKPTTTRRPVLAAALCAVLLAGGAQAAAPEPPLVMLDPGHGPVHPGATSVRGTPEVGYDDAFAALLASRLEHAGFRVALTRGPSEEIPLDARPARAAARGAWLLLSLHHDSAQLRDLAREERDGRPAYRTTRPIRGYSIFVSERNARRGASLRVAQALGRRLLALGRPPTLHHAEPIPGEGRDLLDAKLGIYRFDELRVLAEASCPAVLVELGVIVDETDEAYVSDPVHRVELADALTQALVDVRGR